MGEEQRDAPAPESQGSEPSHIGNPWAMLEALVHRIEQLEKQFVEHIGHAQHFDGQMVEALGLLRRILGLLDGNGESEEPAEGNGNGLMGTQESADQLDRMEEALVILLRLVRESRRPALDQ